MWDLQGKRRKFHPDRRLTASPSVSPILMPQPMPPTSPVLPPPCVDCPHRIQHCSNHYPLPLPSDAVSTPFLKSQACVNPLKVNKNGTGGEKWLVLSHSCLADVSELIYGCEQALKRFRQREGFYIETRT